MHGEGTLITASGDIYSGQWVQNRKEGQGTYKFSDGKQSYQGEFKEDQANGRGKMVYPDDSEYNGQIKNWLKNGEGLLKYSNGDMYTGNWQNDKK